MKHSRWWPLGTLCSLTMLSGCRTLPPAPGACPRPPPLPTSLENLPQSNGEQQAWETFSRNVLEKARALLDGPPTTGR